MADFQAYFSLFLIGLISAVLIRSLMKSRGAKYNFPPTPFALPIIGHLHLLFPSPHQAFHKLSLRHGPIFRLFLGSKPCIVVNSPDTAKEFLKTHEHMFLDRPQSSIFDYLLYATKDESMGPHGPYWKFMRRIMMTELLNKKTLDLLSSVRHDEINRLIKSLSENAEIGKAVDLRSKLVMFTTNVLTRMVMSKRCSENESEADDMRRLLADIIEMTGTFNLSDFIWLFKGLDLQGLWKKVKDTRARYDAMIEKIIKEHEDESKHKDTKQVKDLLSMLLDIAQDETMEIKLSRENIKGFILLLLVGGADTSMTTIEWGLSELINHPNIMKKAIQEIDQVVGKSRLLRESDIPNLPYLQTIVNETLRLHRPGPFIPRQTTRDCTVMGYHVSADTSIFINLYAIGRNPNYWESPLEFRPERFKDNHLDVRGQHFEVLPFGSGKRICPGISLALLMVHTTLGAMIQCFEWKAGKEGNLTSVDMEEGTGLTISRAKPLVCIPVARLDPFPSSM